MNSYLIPDTGTRKIQQAKGFKVKDTENKSHKSFLQVCFS